MTSGHIGFMQIARVALSCCLGNQVVIGFKIFDGSLIYLKIKKFFVCLLGVFGYVVFLIHFCC